MNQNASIGDGIVVLSIAAAIFGYYYLKFRERQRYLEILHEERLVAVEKGIPLPELPFEPLFVKTSRPPDFRVVMLIGMVLLCFGLGSTLAMLVTPGARAYWAAPLPISFIGGGLLIAFAASFRSESGH
ncbi:MAG TPA: hypothetical protein VG944_19835 [Fimbriimonas sp.]|nr:hypothetical protein [Fimbriimonas sp.]